MSRGSLSLAHADGPLCDTRHSSFHPRRNYVRPTSHLLRMSHIRNSVRQRPTFSGCLTSRILSADVPPSLGVSHLKFCPPTSHLLRMSHIRNSVRPTFHLLRIFHIWCLTLDGKEGRFNFPGQTCPDPLIALTRRASATDNSDSSDSLARQILVIRRIHIRPQSKGKLR